MNFFGKKVIKQETVTSQETPQEKPKTKETKERKYFEVFGDTLNQLNLFKTLTLFLAAAVIFQTVIIKTTVKKPPLVIRVDQLGNADAFKNVQSLQKITAPEIINFTQYFLQYFTAYDLYTYKDNLDKAFSMATENCRQKLNDYFAINRVLDDIKNNQLKTKLNIVSIVIVKDAPDYANLKVKGTREVTSYQNPEFSRDIIFEDELSLKKVERTEKTPWGLMVDAWSESLYKNKGTE